MERGRGVRSLLSEQASLAISKESARWVGIYAVRAQERRLGLHRVLVNISVFHRRVGDQCPTLDYCVQIDAGAVKLECREL